MNKKSIYSFTLLQLEDEFAKLELKKFNAKQVFQWIYQKKCDDFNQMSNLSKSTIEILKQNFYFNKLEVLSTIHDDKTDTTKFLFQLEDKQTIETVVMHFDYGYSVCISSQIGCNMGCKFCASGLLKKVRNLTADEIVLQLLTINNILFKNSDEKISNMVVMGIGEPFDNFDNLIIALKIITDHNAIALGSRHVTVSTCGLTDKIVEFAKLMPQINLAISLHAPNDEIRNRLMPINQAYNLKQLFYSINEYFKFSNRRISFEYILLDKVNDQPEHAKQLASLLKGILCYVNIIPYNKVTEYDFNKSKNTQEFVNILKSYDIGVTIRLERGISIDAACGQLRVKYENKN